MTIKKMQKTKSSILNSKLSFYTNGNNPDAVLITPVIMNEFQQWRYQQSDFIKNCLNNDVFKADISTRCLIKNAEGKLQQVLLGVESLDDFWSFAILPRCLPAAIYKIDASHMKPEQLERAILAWGSGSYQFTPYKKQIPVTAQLQIPNECNLPMIENTIRSIFLVRDLINTPADDLTPAELGEATVLLAEEFGGKVKQIIGEELLTENYPTIYTVGRGSAHPPRLIELCWGKNSDPKITLVGKGVCFDSGGLDLKPADGMLLMKKDMGGAAHALGLARMIMAMQLPIQLRVLIPAVENAISDNAYHPGDIITTRKGVTVEVTNTDAEGRLVLCDALTEAAAENPQLIIDFATLTGAAHIALGPEIPSLFTPHDKLANELLEISQQQRDPVWRMPLHKPYRKYLESQVADITNSALTRYAGSITAALFLQEFVGTEIPWVHFDFMAWNPDVRNGGRIFGGEAMALRTTYNYLQKRFGTKE